MSQLNGNMEIISSSSFIFQCRRMIREKSDFLKGTQLVGFRAGWVPGPPGSQPCVLPSLSHPFWAQRPPWSAVLGTGMLDTGCSSFFGLVMPGASTSVLAATWVGL